MTEADGSVVPVFPQEARLRNLTYSAPLYIEMKKRVLVGQEDPNKPYGEMDWRVEGAGDEGMTKVWIGKVGFGTFSCTTVTDRRSRFLSCYDPISAYFQILTTLTCMI